MHRRGLKIFLCVAFALAAIVGFLWKPAVIVSQVNNADQNNRHIRKVFNASRIGQTIDVPAGYVSGIELKILEKKLPDDTPIRLTIKKAPKDNNRLIQINTTLGNVRSGEKITFNFKPVARRKIFFELTAPTLSEIDCIALRYQIDSEKYPGNQTYINEQPVYGDLAFSVRSSPPAFFLAANYVIKHPTVLLAIILFFIALFTSRLKQLINSAPKIATKNRPPEWLQIAVIFGFTLIAFLPLINLYFRQDDFVILDRARTLLAANPFLLLTNRGFVEASRADIPVQIAFYRPISNSITPALLYQFFGTNALPHYLFSFSIHAFSAVGVYYLFRHFLNKNIALPAALVWATHSAVFATVAWLSGIQEVLSAFFLIFSLLSLSLFWNNRQKIYWVISVTLYILAVLSKENAFLYLAIAPLFLFFTKPEAPIFWEKIRRISYLLTPYLFSSALILLLRNWLLDESGLRTAVTDVSYRLSLHPSVIVGNIFACLTWAIQGWVVGNVTKSSGVENYLIKIEETAGWMYFPPPPIMIALSLLAVFITAGFIFRKNGSWRFPVIFYFIACLPFIMLLNERKATWQYFPLIGLILLIGLAAQNYHLINKFLNNKYVSIGLIVLLALASQWTIKRYSVLIEAKKQSAYTKQALAYLQSRHPSIPESTEIVIANVPKDRRQNLGYAAIPLFYNNSTLHTSYPDNPPSIKENDKIYLIYSEGSNTVSEMSFKE